MDKKKKRSLVKSTLIDVVVGSLVGVGFDLLGNELGKTNFSLLDASNEGILVSLGYGTVRSKKDSWFSIKSSSVFFASCVTANYLSYLARHTF